MNNLSQNNFNWYHVFTAGTYPQWVDGKIQMVEVTEADLDEVVASYDPNFYKAPVWIGHPGDAPALAWSSALKREGNKLYSQFDDVSEELKKLTDGRSYRYVSCELFPTIKDGTEVLYYRATGLTNIPLVKGQNPEGLRFSEGQSNKTIFGDFNNTLIFSETNNNSTIFQSKNNSMNDRIKKFAEKLGINLTEFNLATDDDVLAHVEEKIGALRDKYKDDSGQITSLSVYAAKACEYADERPALIAARDENTALKATAIDALVDGGVASGKITPANRDAVKQFAEQNFEAAKLFVEKSAAAPGGGMFAQTQVGDGGSNGLGAGDEAAQKYKDEEGKPLKYSELMTSKMEYIKKNGLTEEDLSHIQKTNP